MSLSGFAGSGGTKASDSRTGRRCICSHFKGRMIHYFFRHWQMGEFSLLRYWDPGWGMGSPEKWFLWNPLLDRSIAFERWLLQLMKLWSLVSEWAQILPGCHTILLCLGRGHPLPAVRSPSVCFSLGRNGSCSAIRSWQDWEGTSCTRESRGPYAGTGATWTIYSPPLDLVHQSLHPGPGEFYKGFSVD